MVSSLGFAAAVSTHQPEAMNTARIPWTVAMETNPVLSGPQHPSGNFPWSVVMVLWNQLLVSCEL